MMTNTTAIKPEQLTLYYSPYCPYCHRVLNALVELGMNVDIEAGNADAITLKNTFSDPRAKSELQHGGGKSTVPCLLISRDDEQQWLYESLDIIEFLQTHLAS